MVVSIEEKGQTRCSIQALMVHSYRTNQTMRYGQVLHGCATTTKTIRRAIQHSQESLRTLAKRMELIEDSSQVAPTQFRGRSADRPKNRNTRTFDRRDVEGASLRRRSSKLTRSASSTSTLPKCGPKKASSISLHRLFDIGEIDASQAGYLGIHALRHAKSALKRRRLTPSRTCSATSDCR